MNKTILIIEDDEGVAELLVTRLQKAGYYASTATDAQLGVQSAHQLKPDLILLDLMLPAGGGINVIENLRKSVNTKRIPIIVMTGMDKSDMKQKLLQLGIKTYIQKPFQPDELIAQIQKALNPPTFDQPS